MFVLVSIVRGISSRSGKTQAVEAVEAIVIGKYVK